MKNRTKISYLLTFFLSLFIASIISFIGFSLGLGNKFLFTNTISKSSYYKTLSGNLNNKTKTLLKDYELPELLGTNLWTETQAYRDMNAYVKKILFEDGDQKEVPDFVTQIGNSLQTRMEEYYQIKKPCEEEEWEKVEEQVVGITISDYHNAIKLPLLETYPEFYQSLNQHCTIVYIVAGLLSILICFLLLSMYYHKYKSAQYMCYAIFSGTTINIVVNFMLQRQLKLQKEYLSDVSYTNLCNEVVEAGFREANIGAYIGLFVGVLLLGGVLWMREKNI